jgi:hypothetical protein
MAGGALSMRYDLTKSQEKAYDKTVAKIRERFGSYHQIAHHCYLASDRLLTGQAFLTWFAERRIPTTFVFVLYEIMDYEIDALTLCPWLAEHVQLKKKVASR